MMATPSFAGYSRQRELGAKTKSNVEMMATATMERPVASDSEEDAEDFVIKNLRGPKQLRFDHTVEEMAALTDEIIKAGNDLVDEIAAVPDSKRTFGNSVFPVAQFESDFSNLTSNISFYRFISPDTAKVQ